MKAEIWNKNGWIKETNPEIIKNYYTNLLKKCGFKVLSFVEHEFNPFGYTALWLLGESHFAVHTFPEENKAYYELSSCNREYFIDFIKDETL